MVKTTRLLAALLLTLLPGCHILSGPAGFWRSYRADLISDQSSDQGPWGGERWISWHSELPGDFSFSDATDFAENHGWKLVAQGHYDSGDLVGQAEMMVGPGPFGPTFLATASTIGRFSTSWVREDPGTGQTTPSFGYLQVSDDGRSVYIHHFWGNG